MQLVPLVYALTRRLPTEERFGLANQLRRATVSIPANIAEGQARQHRREFAHALCVARGSLAEVDTLLLTAVALRYLTDEDIKPARTLAFSIRQLLQALIRHVRSEADALSPRRSASRRTRNAQR